MKVPRDLSGAELAKALSKMGYRQTRQSGSHIRLSRPSSDGDHHITVPDHSPIKVGTLSAVLRDVATRLKMSRSDLMEKLFG